MHLSTPRQSKKDASLLCGLDDPHGSRREERLLRRRSCARVVSRCATAVSRQRFRIRCVMAIYKEGRKKLGKSQRACQSVIVFWRALPFKMDNDTMEPGQIRCLRAATGPVLPFSCLPANGFTDPSSVRAKRFTQPTLLHLQYHLAIDQQSNYDESWSQRKARRCRGLRHKRRR